MQKITHKVFLDDSGNKEYTADGKYIGTGQTPYFVFAGLIVRPETAGTISAAMESLKLHTFNSVNVEVKANWLKRPTERTAKYLLPFKINDEQLNAFVDGVHSLIASTDCELIACAINKAQVQQEYGLERAYYAPAIAYEYVMQRVQQSMEEKQGYAHITVDDMGGNSPKGRAWKANLIRHHALLRKSGSTLRKGMVLDRIAGNEPAFRDSAMDDRVQLADLVAYAVYRQFVDHGSEWENPKSGILPMYQYLQRIEHRFRNRNGRVQGFGIAKFPLLKRVKWQLEQ